MALEINFWIRQKRCDGRVAGGLQARPMNQTDPWSLSLPGFAEIAGKQTPEVWMESASSPFHASR